MPDFTETSKKTVLSTKKLAEHQKQLLINSGLGLVEYDFISVKPLTFELNVIPRNLIFSSQNAVRAVLDHPKIDILKDRKSFAVGVKTSALLRENGFKIARIANYSEELAYEIKEFHKTEEFMFFCGKNRMDIIPEMLKENEIQLTEIEVYDTLLTPKKFDRTFDGVLFFSPSGVESFCRENDLSGSIAFCIGDTTASEARKHTKHVVIAGNPSIENVIVQAVKKLGKNSGPGHLKKSD